MALTLTERKEGVTDNGKRYVEFLATFSDGSAAAITNATQLGLKQVDEVWIKAAASGGSGVDLTGNDGTTTTLDPVAATAPYIRFVGS